MITGHDSSERGIRGQQGRESSEENECSPLEEGGVKLTEEEVERLVHSVGQAYVTMESAGRYVEEQDRAPGSVALVAALAAARRELAAVLVRLLAAWAAAVALGLADIMDYPM